MPSSTPKAKICFVAPWAYGALALDRAVPFVGGAEVQQSILAPALARRGYGVSMITMDFGQPRQSLVQGVRLFKSHAPDAGLPGIRFVYPRLTTLWAALREADADIYYQRSLGALTGLVGAFTRLNNRKFIFAAASDLDVDPESGKIPSWRDRRLSQYGLRSADAVIVQTAKQRDAFRAKSGRSALIVPSCYKCTGHSASLKGPILWVGTIKQLKRPQLLLDIAERMPHRQFVVVGGSYSDDPLYREIRERAGVLKNVECVGHVHFADIEEQFDGGSILVNTSSSEGFPNTFLQAWARGMPTVSFFDPQIHLDGAPVNISAKDMESMVRAIDDCLDSPDEWNKRSKLVRTYYERNHSVERACDEYERLIEQLVAETRWSFANQ